MHQAKGMHLLVNVQFEEVPGVSDMNLHRPSEGSNDELKLVHSFRLYMSAQM